MAPVRIYALITKSGELSDEEFHRYWSQEHPKVWLNIEAVKLHITFYSQFHVDKQAQTGLSPLGVPLGQFDGVAIMEADSLETFLEVYQGKDFLKVVLPDEQKFIDHDKSFVMFGHQEDKKVGGEVLVNI
ncbi:uncharacterized protein A1O9_00721 [Exophiala aquamarina CBS 119918]|uniref:EthD domain-containing protein n=1 Tax=Exophiala aquamarina CBS 119918 TaxID=1182545 RepID=A0A072PTU5_9EURO|nr:uncharacterized protein A1O9_00721 [Exophiala aquamarina CBS 119918]KEF62748.1 hypothetical protein A1O9_00721 [Exophiala aquamarina CBS 119918]